MPFLNTIAVLYCHYRYDPPRTGGEWYHYHMLNYLANRPDIHLQELDANDISALSTWNWDTTRWFAQRFRRLPRNTIVLEASTPYPAFFLANWFTHLQRCRPRFLLLVQEIPYLVGMNRRGRIIESLRFRLFVKSGDRVIVNSRFLRDELIRRGVERRKIIVNPPVAQKLPIPQNVRKASGTCQIICPAHFFPKKGQDILIEAIRLLDDPRVSLVLAGLVKDQRYLQRLMGMVEQYGLSDRVKFVGYLHGQALAEEYARSSIFVFPTLYDTYGIVVQEAMQFGLPIIASNFGGIPEQVTNGVDGLLIPPGDPVALADAIQRVISDSGLRETLVHNAYEKLRTFSTWETVCENVYQVIREMAHK